MSHTAQKATPTQNHFNNVPIWLLVVFYVSASSVSGCRCFIEPPLNTAVGFYNHATSVFKGIVVDIRDWPEGNRTRDGNFVQPTRNEVKEVEVTMYAYGAWKGLDVPLDGHAVASFKTRLGEGSLCGVSFDVGEEYLIYTTQVNGEEWVEGLCGSRFKRLEYAQADISDLDDFAETGQQHETTVETDTTDEVDTTLADTTEASTGTYKTIDASTIQVDTVESDSTHGIATEAAEPYTTDANAAASDVSPEDRKYLR